MATHHTPPLRWNIGEVSITRIVEREVPIRLDALIAEASAQALTPHMDWLSPHFIDGTGTLYRLSIHALVIESKGLRIIVDTCIGEHRTQGMDVLDVPVQPFLKQLSAAGFARETIGRVLCTHLHFDHVGWNTMRVNDEWTPTFPNARYLFSQREWEHWRSHPQREDWSLAQETVAPLMKAGLAQFVEMDFALTPEVRLIPTPGHTPGHVSVLIESKGKRALITGDLTHHPVQWAEPDWGTVADVDSRVAAATRRHLIKRYASDNELLVIGTHYPAPCSGYLSRAGKHVILKTREESGSN